MSSWRFSSACVVLLWILAVLLPNAVASAVTNTSNARIHGASAVVVELPQYDAASLTYDEHVEIAPRPDGVSAMSLTFIGTGQDAAAVAPDLVAR